jgi:magnesium-transporting ATPase (P-type)
MSTGANPSTASEVAAWHAISADEVLKRLATDAGKGLDAAEATTRLQKYGPNRLPEGKKRGPFMRFLSQFNNVLVYVLLGAGFTKLMLNLWIDAAIIFGVVILNGLLGFVQEGKAEKALESIRNMLSAEARTLRSVETRMTAAEELVPGDIVLLESGDKIPADMRLVDAKNLRTEEAALTGESVPANKSTDPVTTNATVGDRECMAFSGTMVVSGRATGVVVATGSATELGRINALLAGVSALETPLLRQIKKFGYAITAVIAVVGALVFAYGKWVKGMDFVELFQAVVGIAVSVIPEGLPAIITITLAIGVQRMAQRNAIIRRLPAVETLGSVSRICSDKTGTLTLMEMMVASAVTAESAYQVTGNGYAPEGQVKKDGKPADKEPVLELMGRVSMLCTTRSCSSKMVFGKWKATLPRGRSIPSRPSSAWTGRLSRPRPRGSTPSPSSRSTSSWQRCTSRPTARCSSSSRARPKSSLSTVIDSRPRAGRRSRSIARTLWVPPTSSPARASACWRSLGSKIPA